MTSDGDALFRAICEQPWEDTPRLAYADWLEETGNYNGRYDPAEARLRAAYIRHQIAYCRQDSSAIHSHITLMRTTFAGCVERWTAAELPVLPGVKWAAIDLRRGFAGYVSLNGVGAFRKYADAIFAAAPVHSLFVHRVTAKTLGDILNSEYLRRVEDFYPRGQIGDDGVIQLSRCAHLCNLTKLILANVGMTDVGLEALARTTVFGRLRMLHFGGNQVTDRGAQALLDSVTLKELKEIGWAPNPLTRAVVRSLRERFLDRYTGEPEA